MCTRSAAASSRGLLTMSIADLQDRAEALGRPGGIANFAEAAPGVERSEAPTVSHGEALALCGPHARSIPSARTARSAPSNGS